MKGIDFSLLFLCFSPWGFMTVNNIHREIQLIFYIIKRGSHCQCDLWKNTQFPLYLWWNALSQDYYSKRKWDWNDEVISIRFYLMIYITCCYEWSCINRSIRYVNFDHYWMSSPVYSSESIFLVNFTTALCQFYIDQNHWHHHRC